MKIHLPAHIRGPKLNGVRANGWMEVELSRIQRSGRNSSGSGKYAGSLFTTKLLISTSVCKYTKQGGTVRSFHKQLKFSLNGNINHNVLEKVPIIQDKDFDLNGGFSLEESRVHVCWLWFLVYHTHFVYMVTLYKVNYLQ